MARPMPREAPVTSAVLPARGESRRLWEDILLWDAALWHGPSWGGIVTRVSLVPADGILMTFLDSMSQRGGDPAHLYP